MSAIRSIADSDASHSHHSCFVPVITAPVRQPTPNSQQLKSREAKLPAELARSVELQSKLFGAEAKVKELNTALTASEAVTQKDIKSIEDLRSADRQTISQLQSNQRFGIAFGRCSFGRSGRPLRLTTRSERTDSDLLECGSGDLLDGACVCD